MEAIERRVAWLTISVAIVLVFNAAGTVYSFQGLGTWELVVHIASLVCLAAAFLLLVASLTPASVRPFPLENRERFAFFAFVLLGLAVVLIAGLATHEAIEAHRHPGIGD
jgi:hypothetical protein